MSTSCMQAIKQQLEAMPLDEFEDLLKDAAVTKGHESRPKHDELINQLKKSSKVQPDEPIETKQTPTEKECKTIWKSFSQKDKNHCPSSNSSMGGGGGGGGSLANNYNGNILHSGTYLQYSTQKHSLCGPGSTSARSYNTTICGDQNANPIASSSNNCSGPTDNGPLYSHHPSSSSSSQHNSIQDIPLQLFPKPASTINPIQLVPVSVDGASTSGSQQQSSSTSSSIVNANLSSSTNGSDDADDQPGTSKTPYYRRSEPLQLKDGYKSVASVTSGTSFAPQYKGTESSFNEVTHGTVVRAVSPPLSSSAMMSKSPSIDGSQLDKHARRGGKKKNGLKEKLYVTDDITGNKGNEDIDKLLAFVEGDELKDAKTKKPAKDAKDKKKDGRVNKGGDKQMLSKAASLDEPLPSITKQRKNSQPDKIKPEDDRSLKPDESDGPYVLVQSKKKRDRKKPNNSALMGENSGRSHLEPNRRESARQRRANTERRKSVGSVPGSENSECSDDDDSVRSLPAGECTPRERIPKPCSSSGGTPQTSYADIARMSKDETGKSAVASPAAPVITASPANVASAVKPEVVVQNGIMERTNSFPELVSSPAAPVITASPANVASALKPEVVMQNGIMERTNSFPELVSSPAAPVITASPANVASALKPEVVVQNGIMERTNSFPELVSSKVPNKNRLEDKRAKEKLVKHSTQTQDDLITKQPFQSKPSSENGDIYSNEPVVFCGGKFDNTQLPPGQKIGFEFGFGVIEALNDNNNPSDIYMNGPKSVEIAPNINSVEAATNTAPVADKAIRSQDKNANFNHVDSHTKSVSLNKELIPQQPNEKSANPPPSTRSVGKNRRLNNFTHSEFSNDSIRLLPTVSASYSITTKFRKSVSAAEPSVSRPSSVPQVSSQLPAVPSGNAPATNPTPAASSASSSKSPPVDNPLKEKLDIAQMFTQPKLVVVPESLNQASAFMENYISKLNTLSKEGKLSYHRVA